jgi:hypothetical protein
MAFLADTVGESRETPSIVYTIPAVLANIQRQSAQLQFMA